jgi:integrase
MSITVDDVQRWIAHLESLQGRDGSLASGTVRHHLSSLSNLYRRARSLGLVQAGFNPVSDLMPGEKPAARREEARWLEVYEAAHLLETARTTRPRRPELACPFLYPLLAACLLTGGRKSEVLGLEVDDVSFDRQTVTFRPNGWRRLKTRKSWRTVPLWPQLAGILRGHIFPLDRTPRSGLLFPSEDRGGAVALLGNFDKALDSIAEAAGWKAGEIRSRIFRNTYAAARLQTLDGDAPVSPYTVSRELGHGSLAMLERIYGHLGAVRHRAPVVEYPAALAAGRRSELAGRSDKSVVTITAGEYPKSLSRP